MNRQHPQASNLLHTDSICACVQSTDPDYAWAVTVMIFYLKGMFGVVGVVLSVCWLLQILLYIFVYPPVTPFLNILFIKLDGAFPLFGTVAFGIFCFYLIGMRSTPPPLLLLFPQTFLRSTCSSVKYEYE